MNNKALNSKSINAFSLAELLLGMALFALLITTVAIFSIDSLRATQNSRIRVEVTQKLQGQKKALLFRKDAIWKDIIDLTDGDSFHLEYSNNTYSIVAGPENNAESTIYINVYPAYRDVEGNLTTTPGTEDLHSKNIVLTAEWKDFLGTTTSLQTSMFLTDWSTLKYEETFESDFDNGSFDFTRVTNTDGGEIKMQTIVYSNWCNPSISMTQFDLPGSAYAKSIVSEDASSVFVGTGNNSSGLSLMHLNINPSNTPSLTVDGQFDGYKVNNIYGEGDYAFLATDTNSKEVVIVDISSNPISEVGSFDADGNSNATAVTYHNNYGYVSSGDTIYTFDASSKTGSRPKLSSIDAGGTISELLVKGDYLYAAVQWGSRELQIFSLSNPAKPALVGWADINGSLGVAIDVNESGTRAYLSTALSFFYPEFFIIDITSKAGSRPTISSYDSSGMWPRDVAITKDYTRAIIVGIFGHEQYQVVDIANENNPQYCGGLSLPNGAHGVSVVKADNGNVFSYLVTGYSSSEFRIIRGGLGGGGSDGIGYPDTATYTSSIFDTESDDAQYYYFEWGKTSPANTAIKFRLRTNDTTDFTGVDFIGPDGTPNTYFTNNTGVEIPTSLSDKRYFQYKAYFSTEDTEATAILNNVILTYQK